MKGILLAGGTGSRLYPTTKSINKHLIPVFDKPLIYYPLTTLILMGISEILVITSEESQSHFEKLFDHFPSFGIRTKFTVQNLPVGLPDAFNLMPEGWADEGVCLILGDNVFYGAGLGLSLRKERETRGAHIFLHHVSNPSDYGVAELTNSGELFRMVEKPREPRSSLAVTGMYIFDSSVRERVAKLKPSARGELEIVDLLNDFLSTSDLGYTLLDRGTTWLDAGTPQRLLEASAFIHAIEQRQGIKVGVPEEAAYRSNLVSKREMLDSLRNLVDGAYKQYLEEICND